ncbi:MAG: PKD domain-containing protein, partial [Chloroflexia bacterium]
DGVTSTLEHPTHTYALAGTYTVTLTAAGRCGADVETGIVEVGGAPPRWRIYLPLVLRGWAGGR